MLLDLNIGLRVSDVDPIEPGQPIFAYNALRVVRALLGEPALVDVRPSDTEPTLVLRIDYTEAADYKAQVYRLACALGQDCIAVYRPGDGTGDLIGPRADSWGTFNPEYFLGWDGVVTPRGAAGYYYQIESRAGVVYGVYPGATPRDAFLAMLSLSGGTYGEPPVGTESDWIIKRV